MRMAPLRRATFHSAAVRAGLAAAMLLASVPATAQLLPASARSLALAGNDTAVARAFGAISVNPAGLAMPGSEFSLTLLPVRVHAGSGPITLAAWKDHEGKVVSHATKTGWMDDVDAAAGQRISAGFGTSEVALTFWNVGLQLSTIAGADGRLPPDVVEALLFGNAGRTCPRERTGCTPRPKTLSFAQGSATASATSTAALSAAFPLAEWMADVEMMQAFDQLSLGVTVTYTQGHAVAVVETAGGIPPDEPRAEFGGSAVHTRVVTEGDVFSHYLNAGSGLGLDLGVMFTLDSLPELTLGASVQNLFNTFAWDTSKLVSQNVAGSIDNGKVTLDPDLDDITSSAGAPYAEAAPATRERVSDFTFKPTVRAGAAYDVLEELTVSGDVHYRFGRGIAFDPQFHVGAGAEYRVLDPLHLRAGLAYLSDDFSVHVFRFSGGLSAILGPVNLSLAVAGQSNGEVLGQFVLSFGNR